MELAVLNTQGKETGRKVVLSDAVFGVEANDHAIYLDVKQYLADQRQGTHKSKQRNEVAGSTRKLKRQKGTGGARAGSIKSPLFPGGGRIFGPQPRDYSFKLNKKLKQLARRSALTYKAQAGAISIVETMSLEAPKTKSVVALAEALKVDDKKVLLVFCFGFFSSGIMPLSAEKIIPRKQAEAAAPLNMSISSPLSRRHTGRHKYHR